VVRNKHYAAWIILICVVVFAISHTSVERIADPLILKPATWQAHPWTLVTTLFVHYNWQHLLINLFLLVQFGPVLERRIGSKRFLIIFLVCGVLGSIFNIYIISALKIMGASAAIIGSMACLAAIDRDNKVMLTYPPMIVNITTAVMFYFLADVFALGGSPDMVDHIAHIVGAISGYVLGRMIVLEGGKRRRF